MSANNNNHSNHSHNNGGINTSGSTGANDLGQHHASVQQVRQGQSSDPLMHRTVDELLSSDFPLGVGNGGHPDGSLNSGVQGNIMEGLDDLFGDDFSPVNTNNSGNMGASLQPAHSLAPNMHFTASHSSQNQMSPMQQHQQLQDQHRIMPQHQQAHSAMDPPLAHPRQLAGHGGHVGHAGSMPLHGQQVHQLGSTPSHLSHSPQVSPAMSHVTPGVPQIQNRAQQPSSSMPPQFQAQQLHQQQVQPGVGPRPIYQQQQQHVQQQQAPSVQQTFPRPAQSNVVQMPPMSAVQTQPRPSPGVPNGQLATPAVARPPSAAGPLAAPAAAATVPIAQAGSPLHHILTSISPAAGIQLRNLFALLQSNAVTPNEFLARAEQLLDPAQFEILDGIRRRHGAARPDGPSPTASAATSPSPSGSGSQTPNAAPSSAAIQSGSARIGQPGMGGMQGAGIHTPGTTTGVSLPSTTTPVSVSTPAPAPPLPATASLAQHTPSPLMVMAGVPATSISTPQSAPVRKRNTDTTVSSTTPSESKVASKRVKTEHQNLIPGSAGTTTNGPTTSAAAPTSFPSTPGPATPAAASSPGVFNRVSLPGQQKASVMASGSGAAAGAGASGSATGGLGAASRSSASAGGGGGGSGAGAGGVERVNYDNITDVMGYVGVDLKEESDNIMRDNDGYSRSGGGDGQDRTRIQNFVNTTLLKTIVGRIAESHKLEITDPDVLAYLAMAAQERLRGLAEQMILASKHRGRSLATAPPPMYENDHAMYRVAVGQDVKKQLLAIERVEREDETKRKEQIAERERRLAAGEDLDENGDPRAGGPNAAAKKGKKQKEGGPGVSARNMTEEARKKVANQTALGFAGGSGRTYSWMMGGGPGGGGGGGGGGAMGGGGGMGGADGGAASPLPSVSTPGASGAGGATNAGSPSASGGVSVGGSNAATGPSKPGLTRGSTMPASLTASSSGLALASSSGASGNAGAAGVGSPGLSSGALASTSSALLSPSLSRGVGSGGGSMILPPSTVGRPSSLLRDGARKVNVKDALFCLERDRGGGGGEGSGQRVLIKSYVKWLK